MDIIEAELAKRKDEILKDTKSLFETNMKITDWDIPEPDNKKAAKLLLEIIKEGISEIEKDIAKGKYDY